MARSTRSSRPRPAKRPPRRASWPRRASIRAERAERAQAANLAAERAKQPVTFKQSAETHLEAHAPSWKHKYARATWFNSVKKYAYPILGDIPTNDIVATHVAAVVRAAAADGNLATGKLVQQRIRKIMNGAIARGERDPLRGNPGDGGLVGAIVPLKRKTVHFRRIELDDAPVDVQRHS